jgi:hypothetical protein
VPVTGAKYRKLPYGPVPDEAKDVIDEMESDGEVEQVKAVTFTNNKLDKNKFVQHRLISKNAKFDASRFSGSELEIIERVAKRWEEATAKDMENASHKEAPWAGTEDGKAIDYEMAHYRSPGTDNEEVDLILGKSEAFMKFVSSLK